MPRRGTKNHRKTLQMEFNHETVYFQIQKDLDKNQSSRVHITVTRLVLSPRYLGHLGLSHLR